MKTIHILKTAGMILCVVNLLTACSTVRLTPPTDAIIPKLAGGPKRHRDVEPPISPEIKNGKVTFRLSAPRSKQVSLNLIGVTNNLPMHENLRGVWKITVEGLPPAIYQYNFRVDGISLPDPGNPDVKLGLRTTDSILEVPTNPPAFYDVKDVPHGTITIHTFKTKTTGQWRQLQVYLPPGYYEHPEQRYPVLYLLHGGGDDGRGWPTIGRAPEIADNLLADGKIAPMIIVMPDVSYKDPEGIGMTQCETDMLEVILPLAESNYRIQADADHRALAGLSMGAGQTLAIGVKHPELFHWLGVFSNGNPKRHPYINKEELDAANGKLSLLWIAIGRNDSLMRDYRRLEKLLHEEKFQHVSTVTSGAHTWTNWRNYLNQFLPLLFTK